MIPLRILPFFAVLGCTQLGLYLTVRALFFPRAGQRAGRRLAGGAILAASLSLPLYGALLRNGVELSPALRWLLFYPLLCWNVMAIPILLLLGSGLSVARRLSAPLRPGGTAHPGPPAREPGSRTAAPGPRAVAPEPRTAAPEPGAGDRERPGPAPAAPGADPAFNPSPGEPALPESRRLFLARGSLALLGGAAWASLAGVTEAEAPPLVTRREIRLDGLHPDLDGLTLLQLSDIHAGSLVTEKRMAAWSAQAAALRPDLVVFTGDLLDGSGRAAGPYSRAFGPLRGALGTFAIFGNHDYYAGVRHASRAVHDAAHTLLRNSGARVVRGRGSLWIGGIDDPLGEVDAERALHGAAPEEPRVMLAHRPGLFEHCAEAGAQLVLSGHTHGGQIALSRTLSPARLIGRYVMGHYAQDPIEPGHRQHGPAQLYVHRGMGVVGAVPIRLGSPPELALLVLRRS